MAGLGDMKVVGVLRAENLERATKFYTEVLGLKAQVSAGLMPGTFTAGGGSMVSIYERPGMPAPQNTTLQFGVPKDRFEDVIAELRAGGVVFEDYDLPEIGLKTVDGIAEIEGNTVAWFKDSEDNIISIGSM